jgi:hypothetical protein
MNPKRDSSEDRRELLQACGQIWRPAQQVIRAQGKSVVFCCSGKHTECTRIRAHALVPLVGTADDVNRPGEPHWTRDSEGAGDIRSSLLWRRGAGIL